MNQIVDELIALSKSNDFGSIFLDGLNFFEKNDSHYNKLLSECKKHVDLQDPNIVYKSSFINDLIIMKKMPDTRTNETREVSNNQYAKFRADKLLVVFIININHLIPKTSVVNAFDRKEFEYKLNEIAEEPNFNNNLEIVCSDGIHYFKTLACAYFYRRYTWNLCCKSSIKWSENGDLETEYIWDETTKKHYLTLDSIDPSDNLTHIKIWNSDMQLYRCFNMKNPAQYRFFSGDTYSHIEHKDENNILQGEYVSIYTNGTVREHGFYKNNMKTGKWTMFSEKGGKLKEGAFQNGNKIGRWSYLDEKNNIVSDLIHFSDSHYNTEFGIRVEMCNDKPCVATGFFGTDGKYGTWYYFKQPPHMNSGDIEDNLVLTHTYSYNNEYYECVNYYVNDGQSLPEDRRTISTKKLYYIGNNRKVYSRGDYHLDNRIGRWEYFYENGNYLCYGDYGKNSNKIKYNVDNDEIRNRTGKWHFFDEEMREKIVIYVAGFVVGEKLML